MAVRPVRKIALLYHAYSPEFGEEQKHYVSFPVEPGPQACLIEIKQGHRLEVIDALTVVPHGIGEQAGRVVDFLYERWLGVIARYYAREAKKARDNWEFAPLGKANVWDPPFSPLRHRRLLEAASEFLDDCRDMENSQLADITSRTLATFKKSIVTAEIWYTRHLQTGSAKEACAEQWRILSCWEAWARGTRRKDGKRQKMLWIDRLTDYSDCYPTRPAHVKQQGRTRRVSADLAAFKKRCAHIGLLQEYDSEGHRKARSFRRFAH